MTRKQLAGILSSTFNAFGEEPKVHDMAIEHGLIDHVNCSLLSLRRLERLSKFQLCIVISDLVEAARESNNPIIVKYAVLATDALFSVDPPFEGGFDSLLNGRSTPMPLYGLFSSCLALLHPQNPITEKWLDLQYKWCELRLDGLDDGVST